MSLPQHRMAEWMHKLEKAADSRYPPAEELEEEAVPALDQTRMSEDGCPHAPPDESHLPLWEGTAGLAVQTITARAEKELAALLCGTGLRFSLKVVIDGEQNGSRRLFAASAGTLTPPAQTYRPDGTATISRETIKARLEQIRASMLRGISHGNDIAQCREYIEKARMLEWVLGECPAMLLTDSLTLKKALAAIRERKNIGLPTFTSPVDRCLCGGVGCNSCEPRGG